MSLNHYVENSHKTYMNCFINSIKIDGDWTYKESDKADNDNLVLDSSLIAQWDAINGASTPYGNGIAVRVASQLISSLKAPLFLNYLAPFSALYTFSDGTDHITFNSTGYHAIFYNVAYKVNVNFPVNLRLQTDTTGIYVDIPGTQISSIPGTLIFANYPDFSFPQETVLCNVCLYNVLNAGDSIRLAAVGPSYATSVDSVVSTLTIIKL